MDHLSARAGGEPFRTAPAMKGQEDAKACLPCRLGLWRAWHPPEGAPIASHHLLDMAVVISIKDAGINRLTFDIIFTSGENYEAALHSNMFTRCSVAKLLNLPLERVVGSYFVDSCNAIKISIDRPNISASLDERDVFGAQQQAEIERMVVPIHASALAKVSSF
jgi:hypothetical protein